MIWIRSAWWDIPWIWSGPLIAALLLWHIPLFWVLLFAFDTGHLISPIALAWSHRGYRSIALRRWVRHLAVPGCILAWGIITPSLIGAPLDVNLPLLAHNLWNYQLTALAFYRHPLLAFLFVVGTIATLWNIYHFGAQNFGFVSIYKRRLNGRLHTLHPYLGSRAATKWAAITATALAFVVAKLTLPFNAIVAGLVIVQHWLAAIGISSHVWSNHTGRSPWWFAGSVIGIGAVIFWLVIQPSTPTMVGFRISLGIVHFLYDRWIWRRDSPIMRAVTGPKLRLVEAA